MIVCYSSSRVRLNKLKNRCTSVSTRKQITYTENGRKSTRKVIEEYEESADDSSSQIKKKF